MFIINFQETRTYVKLKVVKSDKESQGTKKGITFIKILSYKWIKYLK